MIVVIASPLVNRKIKFCAARNEEEEEEEERTDGGSEEFEVSAAQEAVVRVFERVIEVTAESVGMVLGTGSLVSCRLLAKVNQVGSVIGKGGMVVDLIRKETGCRIKVITSENLPACTLPGDKVVEVRAFLFLDLVGCYLQFSLELGKRFNFGGNPLLLHLVFIGKEYLVHAS